MVMGESCYWRFKGEKAFRYGYPTMIRGTRGLVQMGLYNGDRSGGPIVDPSEIEVRR